MMQMVNKLNAVGCSISDFVSSGTDLMEMLSSFGSSEYVVFPGFCDVHVHFREPGFSYKETIESGSKASARGSMRETSGNPAPLSHLLMARSETPIFSANCF